MMNDTSHPLLLNPSIGLPLDTIMALSENARHLYDTIYDYCTYASDPQYQTLHTFRNKIANIADLRERVILIDYFNADPAIRWNGIPADPYAYYAQPY
jgi:hypothetical protein